MPLDANLENWTDDLAGETWAGIVVGNGASLAIWEKFDYSSLYELAASGDLERTLVTADIALFEAMETQNFERVLAALATTRAVQNVIGQDTSAVLERYESIQAALAAAVHGRHVPWLALDDSTKTCVREALLKYDSVYSTNYDLLVYWSVMHDGAAGFKDYFWRSMFDLGDTEMWGPETAVLYLHGGLHLCRTRWGGTVKRRATGERTLLDQFGDPKEAEALPLLVAEGNSKDKLASIYSSDYLGFSYSKLASHQGSLVIFGHSLGESDKHIADAIRSAAPESIAVSIRGMDEEDVIRQKAHFSEKLARGDLRFFDAATHPLGLPELNIDSAADRAS